MTGAVEARGALSNIFDDLFTSLLVEEHSALFNIARGIVVFSRGVPSLDLLLPTFVAFLPTYYFTSDEEFV